MRASAQCVSVLKNVRAAKCLSTPSTQALRYKIKPRFRFPEAVALFQVRERACTGLLI